MNYIVNKRSFTDGSKNIILFILLFFALLLLFIFNVAFGSVNIALTDLFSILLGSGSEDGPAYYIIHRSRLPQAVTATLAGAALAVGGLQMQALFRNPLADPSILGVSSGAGLGVAVVLMMGGISGFVLSKMGWVGHLTITTAAFAGALLVLFFILMLANKLRDNAMLLIAGIMVGYGASALVGILKFYSMQEDVHAFVIWGLGSFASVSWSRMEVFFPVLMVALAGSLLLIKPLNLMMLGDNYASNLGVNIRLFRFLILGCTGLLTATVTAFCGPIAFLGLAVPHLTRGVFKTSNQQILVPAVMLSGAIVALFSNLIARMPGFDGALPINAVTSMIGAPVVIWVILRNRKVLQ
ncbi:iron ABC transporter permease [Marinilabiliaceae bacterium ANBcel2]|nr:iron ABC transporter permease [Marinilabiliaceae bacterium ANBcel2]